MKGVELYAQVRLAVQIEGISRREAARRFGIDPRTVSKMLAFSMPPGYRRSRPPRRPKLDPFTGIIDGILEEDKSRPGKQRHTSTRYRTRALFAPRNGFNADHASAVHDALPSARAWFNAAFEDELTRLVNACPPDF